MCRAVKVPRVRKDHLGRMRFARRRRPAQRSRRPMVQRPREHRQKRAVFPALESVPEKECLTAGYPSDSRPLCAAWIRRRRSPRSGRRQSGLPRPTPPTTTRFPTGFCTPPAPQNNSWKPPATSSRSTTPGTLSTTADKAPDLQQAVPGRDSLVLHDGLRRSTKQSGGAARSSPGSTAGSGA